LTEFRIGDRTAFLPTEREFLSPRARAAVLAGGSGTLRTGEIAPHLRFVKTGPESSRIELANAGQLTVIRGLVFTITSIPATFDPGTGWTTTPPVRYRLPASRAEAGYAL
jgi:hypothetical protein